ncbi:LLM class flavin-dependent oxidoreductase [Streptomyces sp. NPDC002779]|uniref:LLM class flavin-dependent oxidoreductase n=1 Tax=Streptomyces sp. NPDC002779 TaxID=3364664 RepID=UPI003694EC85
MGGWGRDGPRRAGSAHRTHGHCVHRSTSRAVPSPGLRLWLGAYGPRMLTVTGAKADGWLPSYAYLGLDALPAPVRRIGEVPAKAGRDPASIRKVYNISVHTAGNERVRAVARTRPRAVDPYVRHGGRPRGPCRARLTQPKYLASHRFGVSF